jgi:acetyl esterase/lipase
MTNFKKNICAFIFVLLLFTGCKKTEEVSYQVKAEAETFLNLAYGADPKQVMDVYLPANRTSNTATIIFIHGGSFVGGDKSQYTSMAKYLAESGFAVLNINYRLVDATGIYNVPPLHKESLVKIKDQVADVGSVVDYVITRAKKWVISGERLGVIGHSAGGSLGLLYAYDVKNTNKIKAVSNLAGALDLAITTIPSWQVYPAYIKEGLFRFTGVEIAVENEAVFKGISPLYVVNDVKKVPTLNIFPQNNFVDGLPLQDRVTYNKFTARLNELKVPNEFFYVAGADHSFSKQGNWQLVLEKSLSYFKDKLF